MMLGLWAALACLDGPSHRLVEGPAREGDAHLEVNVPLGDRSVRLRQATRVTWAEDGEALVTLAPFDAVLFDGLRVVGNVRLDQPETFPRLGWQARASRRFDRCLAVPGGMSLGCHRRNQRKHLGWDANPHHLAAWAEHRLTEEHAELLELTGHTDLREAMDSLRDSQAFASFEAMETKAREDIADIEALALLPAPPCQLATGHDNIGSYADGSWELDADYGTATLAVSRPLAVHECLGHHTSHANRGNDARWFSGFEEGWAMLAEQNLALDAGLYTDPQDELGLRIYRIWRYTRVLGDIRYWVHGVGEDGLNAIYRDNTPLPARHITIDTARIRRSPARMTAHAIGWHVWRNVHKNLPPEVDHQAFYLEMLSEGTLPLVLVPIKAQAVLQAPPPQGI